MSGTEGEGKKVGRRINWFRLLVVLLVFLALLAMLLVAGMYGCLLIVDKQFAPTSQIAGQGAAKINILLLGVDDETLDQGKKVKRAGPVVVASVNPRGWATHFLLIPNNTQVQVPGNKGIERLADVYTAGGEDLVKRTVEQLLAIQISYKLTMDWQGLLKAVDTLGGIDLYVENKLDYENVKKQIVIHLTKGYQHLSGDQVGQYVSFNYDELGDVGRLERQVHFLKALGDSLFQFDHLLVLPNLLSVYKQYGATDIPPGVLLKVASTIKGFGGGALRSELLPGKFSTTDGVRYWVMDKTQTKQLVDELVNQ